MLNLFAQVAEVFTRRQRKKIEDFDALAKTIAAGGDKTPNPADIAAALDEAGKTPLDLEREVARRKDRQELAHGLARVPGLRAQLAEVGTAYKTEQEAVRAPGTRTRKNEAPAYRPRAVPGDANHRSRGRGPSCSPITAEHWRTSWSKTARGRPP